jgi:hypothetical protein
MLTPSGMSIVSDERMVFIVFSLAAGGHRTKFSVLNVWGFRVRVLEIEFERGVL